VPTLRVRIAGGAASAAAAVDALKRRDPPIWVNVDGDELVVDPLGLDSRDAALVGTALRETMDAGGLA
jgi:hypothetical protein